MRAALLTAAAVTIAASAASAANFDVNGADGTLDDMSSGTSIIEDCTQGVDADLVPGLYVADADDWLLDAVRITSPTAGLAARCADFAVTVVIERGDVLDPVSLGPIVIDGTGSDVIDLPVEDVLIGPATAVSVLVDGSSGTSTTTIPTVADPADIDSEVLNLSPYRTYANPAYTGVSQSFTPSTTGDLYAIDIMCGYAARTQTVQVIAGDDPAAAPLHSQSETLCGDFSTFTTVMLTTPVPVTAGQIYTFTVLGDASGFQAQATGTGHQYQWSGGSWYDTNPGGGGPTTVIPHRTYVS